MRKWCIHFMNVCEQAGIVNICVHKGLFRPSIEQKVSTPSGALHMCENVGKVSEGLAATILCARRC